MYIAQLLRSGAVRSTDAPDAQRKASPGHHVMLAARWVIQLRAAHPHLRHVRRISPHAERSGTLAQPALRQQPTSAAQARASMSVRERRRQWSGAAHLCRHTLPCTRRARGMSWPKGWRWKSKSSPATHKEVLDAARTRSHSRSRSSPAPRERVRERGRAAARAAAGAAAQAAAAAAAARATAGAAATHRKSAPHPLHTKYRPVQQQRVRCTTIARCAAPLCFARPAPAPPPRPDWAPTARPPAAAPCGCAPGSRGSVCPRWASAARSASAVAGAALVRQRVSAGRRGTARGRTLPTLALRSRHGHVVQQRQSLARKHGASVDGQARQVNVVGQTGRGQRHCPHSICWRKLTHARQRERTLTAHAQ